MSYAAYLAGLACESVFLNGLLQKLQSAKSSVPHRAAVCFYRGGRSDILLSSNE